MNLPPVVTQLKWLPTSSAAAPTVIRSLTHSHACCCCCYCSIRIQIPFYQFTSASCKQRSFGCACSLSLSRRSLPHSCTALHALSDIRLPAPAACDCVRHSPTAFGSLCSAVHSLSHCRSFHLPASSRQAHSHTAFGLPSTLFNFALSLPLPAPSAPST